MSADLILRNRILKLRQVFFLLLACDHRMVLLDCSVLCISGFTVTRLYLIGQCKVLQVQCLSDSIEAVPSKSTSALLCMLCSRFGCERVFIP